MDALPGLRSGDRRRRIFFGSIIRGQEPRPSDITMRAPFLDRFVLSLSACDGTYQFYERVQGFFERFGTPRGRWLFIDPRSRTYFTEGLEEPRSLPPDWTANFGEGFFSNLFGPGGPDGNYFDGPLGGFSRGGCPGGGCGGRFLSNEDVFLG